MVPEEPEHGIVNQYPGSLHFNIPERPFHKPHHNPEVSQKAAVLLGLGIAGKH
jgi:hypothetical protein